ncbi:MAG: hypothetical protein DLM67_02110 [Candidatus Nephthysia bennettiae]|nr:MAG: hypothetical protein DLM67_02110 [Candidatus Dormibacteraeota bacterium]
MLDPFPAGGEEYRLIHMPHGGLMMKVLERSLIVEANPACCPVCGCSREEPLGAHHQPFIHDWSQPLSQKYMSEQLLEEPE